MHTFEYNKYYTLYNVKCILCSVAYSVHCTMDMVEHKLYKSNNITHVPS